jgi:hypothetical protein
LPLDEVFLVAPVAPEVRELARELAAVVLLQHRRGRPLRAEHVDLGLVLGVELVVLLRADLALADDDLACAPRNAGIGRASRRRAISFASAPPMSAGMRARISPVDNLASELLLLLGVYRLSRASAAICTGLDPFGRRPWRVITLIYGKRLGLEQLHHALGDLHGARLVGNALWP